LSRTVITLTSNRAVYTVKDVAYLLTLDQSTVYAWLRNGTLPGIKSGGRWGVPKKRLHQWMRYTGRPHRQHPSEGEPPR
jgi:excisionase family DNA binding protein